MTTEVIYDVQTEDYYIFCEHRKEQNQYFFYCYLKYKRHVRYNVGSYYEQPSIDFIIEKTKKSPVKSKRPYTAGQACDGSISSPALYLAMQLCDAFQLDFISCYHEAYNEDVMTKETTKQISSFAMWQGVEIIQSWNKKKIEKVMDSLTAINYHQFRAVLETKLTSILKH